MRQASSGSQAIFFSTRKGSVAALRFPNGRVWIVDSSPETMFNHPFRDAVGPWLRTHDLARLDAIAIPQLSGNAVHDLDPLLRYRTPGRIISPPFSGDSLGHEDFLMFAREYSVPLAEMSEAFRFVPSPACTCWFPVPGQLPAPLPAQPGLACFSIHGTHLLVAPTGADSALVAAVRGFFKPLALLRDSTVEIDKSSIGPQRGVGAAAWTLGLEKWSHSIREGAVVLNVDRKGKMRIRTFP
jgi:hypothetical protein